MNLKQYPDILTVKDVAKILKIGINSAYMLIKSGEIPSHKIGRIYRIPKICLFQYLKSAKRITVQTAVVKGENHDWSFTNQKR